MTAPRLPDGLRLGAVTLQVADLQRSLAFYRDGLGFRLVDREDGRARLGAAGATAPLIELVERPGAAPVPPHGRLGLYHVAYLLPDRPALGRFAARLLELGVRVGSADHLVSEAFYLADPDGLGIEVYADRPRSQWPRSERGIVLATEPLDVHGLMRSAAGEAWDGMPEGTSVGHVHLHVGELARARRIYADGLGFEVVMAVPGAAFLAAGGYHHHLGINTWAGMAPPPTDDEARLLRWRIVLDDAAAVEAAVQGARAADPAVRIETGGEAGAAAAADGGGVARTVRDPWGTAVTVTAPASP